MMSDLLALLFFHDLEAGRIDFEHMEGYRDAARALAARTEADEGLEELVYRRSILENECCYRSGFRAALRLLLQGSD